MSEQEKRERVVKGLECRLDVNGSKFTHCLICDYRHDVDHCQWTCQTDGILEDALTLLKAQEPVRPVTGLWDRDIRLFNCGACGGGIGAGGIAKYCLHCGRAVKWE